MSDSTVDTSGDIHFETNFAGIIGKPSEKGGYYTITLFDDEQERALKLRLGVDARQALHDILQEAADSGR